MDNKANLLSKESTTKQNRIWVRIAAACNTKCVFCLDSDAQNGTFPSDESIKEKIRNGWKAWYENRIIISWWEASINPKFSEYIKYSKEVWYDRVQTVTNGNMYRSLDFCKKVVNAWLEEITFSFHGHNSKLHDYLVDASGSFERALTGLINIKKYFPHVIVNIDIVVCKPNIKYLPNIVQFFMRFWVYEYDILQIIPFWRWFNENKSKLFYKTEDYAAELLSTWKLSRVPWMYMWTNRFPAESFEWYEDLIQDPRKFKSETMWESHEMFEEFILSKWKVKPHCFWSACDVCFQHQYCHRYLETLDTKKLSIKKQDYVLDGKNFPSEVFKSYGENENNFKEFLNKKSTEYKRIINVPKCLWGSWIYQSYNDVKSEESLGDYTYRYIDTLYRKKSLKCNQCIHYDSCEGIHINFIRSYGFKILQAIKW